MPYYTNFFWATFFTLYNALEFSTGACQVGMKNVVECKREFFAYFNALETRGVTVNYIYNRIQKIFAFLAYRIYQALIMMYISAKLKLAFYEHN